MINSLEGKSLTSVCLWQCCCFSHQITSTEQIARSTSPLTHFTTGSDRGRQVMRNRKGREVRVLEAILTHTLMDLFVDGRFSVCAAWDFQPFH